MESQASNGRHAHMNISGLHMNNLALPNGYFGFLRIIQEEVPQLCSGNTVTSHV